LKSNINTLIRLLFPSETEPTSLERAFRGDLMIGSIEESSEISCEPHKLQILTTEEIDLVSKGLV